MIDRNRLQNMIQELNIRADSEALDRFDCYAEALLETNQYLNLTAITEPDEVTDKHFADSLSVFSVCDPFPGAKWLDVGTGAGFPGAVLLMTRPDLQMTLLDGTLKKLRFVDDTLRKVGLSAEIVHARAEETGQDPRYREQFDYVTARAVANLRELTEYCIPFVRVGGFFIAMKSVKSSEEIGQAEGAIRLMGGKIDKVSAWTLPNSESRTLIRIKKISQTPPKYPRPSAKIAKHPLR